MNATTSQTVTRPVRRGRSSSKHSASSRSRARGARREGTRAAASGRPLGCYVDACDRLREVVALSAAAGSVLVVDRDAATLGERRLVAHLAADEPAQNARIVCELYLADCSRGHCREVVPADLEEPTSWESRVSQEPLPLVDEHGRQYGLEAVPGPRSVPDLRWVVHGDHDPGGAALSVRDVVARMQSYEPARCITSAAIARRGRGGASVSLLRGELERLDSSRIVLNRALREAVLEAMRREGVSASEIAIRCRRAKRDARGNLAGETSWLARRIGLVPEGGHAHPTPWIHSEVLALIAREGLGVSPYEVELG